MRRSWIAAATVALLCLLIAEKPAAAASRNSSGNIVIVFKDGHRQSFNMADIDRIEFPGSTGGSKSSADLPPRGRFFGKWEVGDGVGNTFTITLREDGTALRSLRDMRGHWSYVNGEAQITWDDGAKDAIRRVGNQYHKCAYGPGKPFTDQPDNETEAHNTTPRPI